MKQISQRRRARVYRDLETAIFFLNNNGIH